MRKLTPKEEKIAVELLLIANLDVDVKTLLVADMDDGGMGSLVIGENYGSRKFGAKVAEYTFNDTDGVEVSVTLNVDSDHQLYEIDIWKVDYSPTQRLR